jgi:hypothetical protein
MQVAAHLFTVDATGGQAVMLVIAPIVASMNRSINVHQQDFLHPHLDRFHPAGRNLTNISYPDKPYINHRFSPLVIVGVIG